MNQFAKNGDKLLAFLTMAAALAQTQGLVAGPALKWFVFGGARATLAHTIFYPNTQVITK